MPWEAVNRPAAAKAVRLNAGSSINATTKLCHFNRLLAAGFSVYHRERERINHFERAG